jgi:hypothetical protein
MLKRILSKLSAGKKCSTLMFAALSIALLAGCAAQKVKESGPVFFPPPPNPPKIQFLMAINSSTDIEAKKDSFSLFLTGKPEEDRTFEIFKPYGVTIHNKKIYVCDLSGKVVIIDTAKKTFEYFQGSGYGGLRKPLNLTFDEAENMYVVDIERKEVLIFNPAGGFVGAIGKEYGIKPSDVLVDAEFVYILDLGNNEIKAFNRSDGKLARSIGKSETSQSLAIPTNFAWDKQGAFRVTNIGTSSVVQIDKDGHQLGTFGKLGDGFGEFARPKGIAVDQQGQIYVVDAAHQNVQVFNDAGRLLMYFGGFGDAGGLMNLPASVAVSKADIDFFKKFVDPSFEMESLIFVTNQFGKAKLSVYGLGKRKGDTDQLAVAPPKATGAEKKSADQSATGNTEPASTGK